MAAKLPILGLAVTLIFTVACSHSESVNPASDHDLPGHQTTSPTYVGRFHLAYGDSARIDTDGTIIKFAEVLGDSRCPTGVYCVWEGEAAIGLELRDSETTHLIPLTIRGLGSIPVPFDTLGYRFLLDTLAPYPVYPDSIPTGDYVATIYIWPLQPEDSGTGLLVIEDGPPALYQIDQWTLDTAWIDGKLLRMNVQYSGGCGEHQLDLFMSPSTFAKSYPAQADLYLRHFDFDDPCDAIVGHQLAFDISPAIDMYERLFEARDSIMFNLYRYYQGQPDGFVTLLYDPREAR